MTKVFDYFYTIQANNELEVEDIGNTCIKVLNNHGYIWYLIVNTKLGETQIKTFGPIDSVKENNFNNGFNFNFTTFDYKESKIITFIDKFINDSKKLISQALVCEVEEAYEQLTKLNLKEMS